MNPPILEDKKAGQLMSRVRNDLSSLRADVRHLVRHTARHTLPDGARGLARSGRAQLRHVREDAADRLRRVGRSAKEHPAGVSVAGVLLLGALAFGAYLLLRDGGAEAEDYELGDEI